MGCRNSNLAVVTTSDNAPTASVTDAKFIMVNPGDLVKDVDIIKTNGYHKQLTVAPAPTDENQSPENKNNSALPGSLLRVKKGIVISPYNQYRKPIPNISIWKFIKGYIDKVIEKNNEDFVWLRDASTKVVITYGEIEPKTRSLASAFYREGMQAHDVVLLLTTNTTYSYLVLLALWRLNVTVKVAFPEDSADVLQRRISESNAQYLVCDDGTSKAGSEAQRRSSIPVTLLSLSPVTIGETVDILEFFKDSGDSFPGDLQDFNLDVNNDIIFIPCTVGTSGQSKGALHTHKTLVAGFMQGGFLRSSTSQYVMMPMRIYHLSGVIWPIASIIQGKSCLVSETISTVGIFDAIQEYVPGTLCGFPSFVVTLALKLHENGNTCPSVTSVVTSGETINSSGLEKLKLSFPNLTQVDVSYVLTELLSVTSTIPYNEPDNTLLSPVGKENQIGMLSCYSSAKVIDPDNGQMLQDNQSGELCFRTHSIMRGYVQQEQAAKRTLINGWIHTGDCGYFDTNGIIYVIGRLNEVFKCDGRYISPSELESVLLDHPDVTECAVVGVPDNNSGAVTCAVVSRRFGASNNTTEIKEFVDSRVAEYQKLRGGVIFMDDLPKNKDGKISRSEVLRMVINLNKMKNLRG
ncbi:unnamed protein product [Allacma fusca]|uniref:4-coumarate--CoA ligase n=1 Tax=Allacma fusca TaxID=39272 RepID=A0A8J2KI00_9HEXA|nr:unnamed protein product [Allacma fusca]